MLALVLVLICVVIGAVAQISMKAGMSQLQLSSVLEFFSISKIWAAFTNPFVFFGALCYALGLILWLAALSKLDVSYAYPLLSIAYVLTAVAAWLFLKESISVVRWAGIFLVIAGSYMIIIT